MLSDAAIAVTVIAGLLASLELGFRAGRWSVKRREAPSAGQVGAVQGAVLGLLGLLLGFSFAAAGSRFLERQDLIVREANAIGTAALRADLLAEPHRSELRAALRDYTRQRVEFGAALNSGKRFDSEMQESVERGQSRIWRAAAAGVEAGGNGGRPEAAVVVLPPVNDVIDIHTLRIAAGTKHLPLLVLGLLIASSVLSMAAIGYGCGLAGRRVSALTWPLLFVVGTALWTTIDLDHPRAGMIRLSDKPLEAVKIEVRGGE